MNYYDKEMVDRGIVIIFLIFCMYAFIAYMIDRKERREMPKKMEITGSDLNRGKKRLQIFFTIEDFCAIIKLASKENLPPAYFVNKIIMDQVQIKVREYKKKGINIYSNTKDLFSK